MGYLPFLQPIWLGQALIWSYLVYVQANIKRKVHTPGNNNNDDVDDGDNEDNADDDDDDENQ